MKNLRTLVFASIATLLVFLPFSSFAAMRDSFFFEPFVTAEYSAPKFYGDSSAKHFATDSIFSQLKNFDNIALGFHGRIHKYIGLNVNWSQTDLSTTSLAGYALEKKATLGLDYINFSGLFFAPVVEDSIIELFGELGFSKMKSKVSIFETNGNYTKKKTSETIPFIGLGFQVAPFESSKDAFRVSFQRYLGKLDLVHANFSTIRIGYVKAF